MSRSSWEVRASVATRIVIPGVIVVITAVMAVMLYLGFVDGLEDARIDTTNLAVLIDGKLQDTLRRAESVVDGAVLRLPLVALDPAQADANRSDIDAGLVIASGRFPELAAVRVYDGHHKLLYSSLDLLGVPDSGADTGPDQATEDRRGYILRIVHHGKINAGSLIVGQQLRGPDGAISGSVEAELDLAGLQTWFSSLDLGKTGIVLVRRTDDYSLLASRPDATVSQVTPADAVRSLIKQGDRAASFDAASPVAGIRRVMAMRVVNGYPFYVAVGFGREEVLASWYWRAAFFGVVWLVTAASLLTLLRLLARSAVIEAATMSELARYKALTDQSGEGIGIAVWTGEVGYMNKAEREMFGVPLDQPVEELHFREFYSLGDATRLSEEIIPHVRAHGQWTGELTINARGGREVPTLHHMFEVRDATGMVHGIANIVTDLTAQRELEGRLRMLGEAFEQSGAGIAVTDAEHRFLAVNRAFTRLTGYSIDEVRGRHPRLMAASGRAVVDNAAMTEAIARHGYWEGENWARRKDGSEFPELMSLSVVRDRAGAVTHFVSSFTDISERKAQEERVEMFRLLAEHAGQGIALATLDGDCLYQNPAERALFEVPNEAPIDAYNFASFYDEETFHRLQTKILPSVREQGQWSGELNVRTLSGRVLPTFHNLFLIRDLAGAPKHYGHVIADLTEQKAREEHIHHLAHHDALTGLANRLNLQGRLDQALMSAKRDEDHVAVLLIDMDRFKVINDTLGHPVGDALLREIGRRLTASVRESDIVARLGGDEFVVVLTGIHSAEGSVRQTEKILDALSEPYQLEEHEFNSTPSIGVALYPEDGTSSEVLMKHADIAMYQAKAGGRNGFRFFTASMNASADERLALEHSMRQGIGRGEFVLFYQPQIDTLSGRPVGFEALVRWRHPERGMISPAKFIPIAEETGIIVPLGEWVLKEALAELARWRAQGILGVRMAVNVSAAQLRTRDFPAMVAQALAESGLAPGDLELEITESVAMEHPEETIGVLRALRDMGIELAIDDFGTGYSSLSYLKLLPIKRLKLDQSFVRDIESDSNDAAICTATIALAHSLGLEVVAEGVETEPQFAFLSRLGTDVAQGYLFSKPVPAAEAVLLAGQGQLMKLAG